MAKIGLHIVAQPHAGGTYQYNLSVIHALDALRARGHEITCFFIHPEWREALPKSFRQVFVRRSVLRRALTRYFPSLNPVIGVIERSDVELVVYPSQEDLPYRCRKPALSAIHDLMHRYEPQLEEYQHGEFEKREKHYSSVCRASRGILVDSEMGRRHVVESYGKSASEIFILPLRPPAYIQTSPDVDLRAKYQLPARFVFYAAQFWTHKNHVRLVEAIKILKDRGVDVTLVLVGSKKNGFEGVMRRITELGLESSVLVPGYVPNEDMASFYRQAVALVFASLIGPTNTPLNEAMQVGCPVVASSAYGMPEQLGGAGLLFDPKSPADMADKIERVWTDEKLRQELIAKGKARSRWYDDEPFNAMLELAINACLKNQKS
ncbi:MAG: glycosyltransferase family 4 protein [Deltaproteobacteria bacterium]|nr:glycosyltransferase family 4 protein [Deltaproteobacteria bacterium]